MAPARFAETAHEHVITRLDIQNGDGASVRGSFDRCENVAKQRTPLKIERDGDVPDACCIQNVQRFVQRSGRKMLYTVKAQIFETFHGLCLAGAGEPGDEHDTGHAHKRGSDGFGGDKERLRSMKTFSPDRANALIPKVAALVEELLAKRRDLAIKLLETDPLLHAKTPPRGSRLAGLRSPFPPPRFGEQKSEIVRLIHRIEALGCIVKDIDLGLVDFPSTRRGEPVYLCWKAGEARITHWHGTDEDFSQRKLVDF
jgi:hypothetical protein